MNDKQARFAQEYVIDLNATQAAIRAGYSEKTAGQQGHDLLKNPEIAAEIERLTKERAERTQITADTVLHELLKIATLDVGQLVDEDGKLLPLREIPEQTRRALAGVEIAREGGRRQDEDDPTWIHKYRTADKIRALELLGKHLKLFTEKVEHSMDESLAQALTKAQQRAESA